MATYNFTVRAVDNTGAFADRNFQMNVNNTQIDRFVMVCASGLLRSVDGTTWNTEPGIVGTYVGFENNQWIVASSDRQFATTVLYNSVDGLNWNRIIPTIPSPTVVGTVTSHSINRIKWRNGAYYGFLHLKTNTPTTYIYEVKSTDLKTWTYAVATNTSSIYSFGSSGFNTTSGVADWDYDPVTDTVVALISAPAQGSVFLWRRVGNAGWTLASTGLKSFTIAIPVVSTQSPSSSYSMGTVTFIGGNWFVNIGQVGIYTSVNAFDWVYRDISAAGGGAVSTFGPIYSNGRLLLQYAAASSTTTNSLAASVDAGHTWAIRPATGGPLVAYTLAQPNFQVFAAYNGTIVTTNPNSTSFIVSKDDGLTWTGVNTTSFGYPMGSPQAIAARNT
ncbi:MAG: hypothetical protein EOP83_05850 [Verrucomicrobiaceae bacterium]|nr:MAG: hypothetical protein EOP83_05850 [Verrucomicrobiaceae bacterium]